MCVKPASLLHLSETLIFTAASGSPSQKLTGVSLKVSTPHYQTGGVGSISDDLSAPWAVELCSLIKRIGPIDQTGSLKKKKKGKRCIL